MCSWFAHSNVNVVRRKTAETRYNKSGRRAHGYPPTGRVRSVPHHYRMWAIYRTDIRKVREQIAYLPLSIRALHTSFNIFRNSN